MKRLLLIATGCLLLTGAGLDASVRPGAKYTDEIHGFSLRPPLGAARQRETGLARLVTWFDQDDAGRLAWQLSVHEATQVADEVATLREQIPDIAARLQREGFEIDRQVVRLTRLADRDAVYFSGTTAGGQVWQRQVWILAEPQRFLIVTVHGPTAQRERVDAVFDTVVPTVELTDPQTHAQILERLRQQTQAGGDLWGRIGAEQLVARLSPRPQWFLFSIEGRHVGWMVQAEERAIQEGHQGVRIRTWAMVEVPNEPVRILVRDMFCSVDRAFERWTERLQIGEDADAVRVNVDGVYTNGKIVSTTRTGRETSTDNQDVPEEWYVPHALGAILPRMLPLDRPGTYAFATYNTADRQVSMRTLSVIGTQVIAIDSQRVASIKLTDRPHHDVAEVEVWVDAHGHLLRTRLTDGLQMLRTSEQNVVRTFPRAEGLARELRDR